MKARHKAILAKADAALFAATDEVLKAAPEEEVRDTCLALATVMFQKGVRLLEACKFNKEQIREVVSDAIDSQG